MSGFRLPWLYTAAIGVKCRDAILPVVSVDVNVNPQWEGLEGLSWNRHLTNDLSLLGCT